MVEMNKRKRALGFFSPILTGLLLIAWGCTSNDAVQPSGQQGKAMFSDEKRSVGQAERDGQSESQAIVAKGAVDASVPQPQEQKVIEGVRIEPSAPVTGDQLSARVSMAATAQSSPELFYRWKRNGQLVQESKSDVLEVAIKRDDFVEVDVSAAQGDFGDTKAVTTYILVGNAPPTMRLTGQAIANDGTYQAKVDSSDPEGDNLELSLKEGPPGMTIDPGGNIRWALDAKTEGAYSVAISARDVHGAETALTFQVRIHREQSGKAS